VRLLVDTHAALWLLNEDQRLSSSADQMLTNPSNEVLLSSLPWHHRDPFDRLLVAQAVLEDAVLLSSDDRLHAYDVRVAW
jgi:PIN domain nuclease of toxin-antitoxin system